MTRKKIYSVVKSMTNDEPTQIVLYEDDFIKVKRGNHCLFWKSTHHDYLAIRRFVWHINSHHEFKPKTERGKRLRLKKNKCNFGHDGCAPPGLSIEAYNNGP